MASMPSSLHLQLLVSWYNFFNPPSRILTNFTFLCQKQRKQNHAILCRPLLMTGQKKLLYMLVNICKGKGMLLKVASNSQSMSHVTLYWINIVNCHTQTHVTSWFFDIGNFQRFPSKKEIWLEFNWTETYGTRMYHILISDLICGVFLTICHLFISNLRQKLNLFLQTVAN